MTRSRAAVAWRFRSNGKEKTMARKIAAASALLVFAISLLLGMSAQNTFSTTVVRALQAMGATFLLGLVLGAMTDRMVRENLSVTVQKNKNSEMKSGAEDR
jgi:threonine/homoserine/homoserine lactone efflux protein